MTCLTPVALAKANERRVKIREMHATVLADLYKEKPEVKARIKKAAGYAVFQTWA